MRTTFGTSLGRAEMKTIKGGCNTPPCTLTWWNCDNCYAVCSIDTPAVESIDGCPGSSTNCVKSSQSCSLPNYYTCC